ncbi:uncharacterized protein C3orf22 homolog isoform X1 [Pseudorca crassidens]|uniref:uncharacterized protein C3orf22 homolog isoform X1 n=1 Tax=Pseudorca crassidens TaxID=82174 RepID=UPI00352F36E4
MDVKAPKGSHQGKKSKNRTEEKFARKFPYSFPIHKGQSNTYLPAWLSSTQSGAWNMESSRRARAISRGWAAAPQEAKCSCRFSWLTETNAEPLQPWKVTKTSSSLRKQLPLQKTLVPTRSVPVRGLGAPDFPPLSSLRPPPSPPSNVWELVLLSRRFPGSALPPTGRCRPPPRGPLLEPSSAPPLSRPPAPRALRAAG